ncbi:2-dehydropantoate 2-reductase N-terminal domain-containing protein [Aeromicrobium sp. NPDC092404]|uniref:ketopantoate reductase family protein n=1 Tax=Aeromicrobium sp. NPDC092404 TaxID=3154976 RepID=UPI003436D690
MTRVDVIGAGVVGTIYAAQLAEAGHDVHLVARGRRADELEGGARIHDIVSGRRSVTPVGVGTSARDTADVVLVAVGAHDLPEAIKLVPTGRAPVVLLGNGIVDVTAGLPAARAVVAFTGAGGTMSGGEVQQFDTDKGKRFPVTIDAHHPAADDVRSLFLSAGVPVDLEPDMASWRRTHHAVVVAMAGALELAGGDPWRLSTTPDIQRVLGRAVKESYVAVRRTGHHLTPAHLARLGKVPEPMLHLAVRQMFTSTFGINRFAAHHRHARLELSHLAGEMEGLLDEAAVLAPSARLLCSRLQDPRPSLIVGSNDLRTDPTAPLAAGLVALAGLHWWSRRRQG